jgi:hypothetical protein
MLMLLFASWTAKAPGQASSAAPTAAVVTIPFYYAQPTIFDAPVNQLVLGVAEHAQPDPMLSNDRKYVTYDVLHPIPKVEQLATFNHEKSYLGWVGCPAPQPVVNKANPQKNGDLLPTVASAPHDAAAPVVSALEKPGMVFIAPAR